MFNDYYFDIVWQEKIHIQKYMEIIVFQIPNHADFMFLRLLFHSPQGREQEHLSVNSAPQ